MTELKLVELSEKHVLVKVCEVGVVVLNVVFKVQNEKKETNCLSNILH